MRFVEQSISDSEPVLRSISREIPTLPTEDFSGSHLAVGLLPAHPFQYPLRRLLKETMTADTVSTLKRQFGFEKISFAAGKTMKKVYGPIIEELRCDVVYLHSEYPAIKEKTRVQTDSRLIDWFAFLVLAKASRGEEFEQAPVSLTIFKENGKIERKWVACDIPVSLSEIAETAGISVSDFTITDHPFTGAVLDPGTRFDKLEPKEILVFPKDGAKRESIVGKFTGKFKVGFGRFLRSYDVTDVYRNSPCQKCLECVRICPAKIYPFLLSAIADKGSLKDAVELDIADCTECGLCSCVCPSGIPLMKSIVGMKKEL